MESFLYDYYGYNVSIHNGGFTYQNYYFLLAATSEEEASILKLNDLCEQLRPLFHEDIVYFVLNKYGKYISTTEDENNICLLAFKLPNETNVEAYSQIHELFYYHFPYVVKLSEIITLWEQRLEYIENQCVVNLNLENEVNVILYENTMYACGMALNALQYLSDTQVDYKKEYASTLCHRRINNLTKLEFLNPFNLLLDHSSRDICELYKNDLITLQEVFYYCNKYHYEMDEYQYLLARLLFPSFIFDIVEDLSNKTNYIASSEIYAAIQKHLKQIEKAKEYYKEALQRINIRPIRWLNP